VVRAGETLVEIVPVEDQLRVEVKVRPSDIAFVHPNQPALVKISAYDFSIYGGLEGAVEKISADTSVDEDTREVFYLVTVRTEDSQLGSGDTEMSIIPGMVASVDIMTGKEDRARLSVEADQQGPPGGPAGALKKLPAPWAWGRRCRPGRWRGRPAGRRCSSML
jgi:multidrug efflux pump subunit AcrA (membrane-fusion protein)